MTRSIPWALVVLLTSWTVATSSPAVAQIQPCFEVDPFIIDIENQGGSSPTSASCGFSGLRCVRPVHLGNEIFLTDPFCDPKAGVCNVTISVPFEFPGVAENAANGNPLPRLYYFDSADPPACTPTFFDNCGAIAICGAPGTPEFRDDFGRTLITVGGISCNNVATNSDVISVSAFVCISSNSCRKRTNVGGLAFGGPAVAAAIGCPVRPPEACNGDAQCSTCAAGGVSVAGGGPADVLGGPGATLRQKAGGTGTTGLPGAAEWATELGEGWSHDYAERIVEDPDPSHVFFLTKFGTFREWTDSNSDGLYETVSPSDEYRTLTFDAATGWELADLDGTVQRFDLTGRWVETEDRNGNLTTATYDASNRLSEVTFPSATSETFAYHMDGKLASITEVGVDGTTTRTWSLTWTGDNLTRMDRPDGTAIELFYDDPNHPHFLTRKDLVGSSGGRRVMRAWAYSDAGNVVATWSGDTAQDGPDAVDLHTFSYDDPLAATVTTVTDPLGQASVYSFDRDPASSKVRINTISGDCPVCGLGPSSSFSYIDDGNPLLPTSITDGKGHMTLLTYDEHGQTTSRTEAASTLVSRITSWGYDTTYPALPISIERPSVDGGASLRTTTFIRDPSGNVTQRIEEGVENGSAFMLSTITSYETSGEALTIDPPGFGTGDVTSFEYDAARGDLIPLLRTDPLIGTTTFTHDAFNRRTQVTDPNAVTTVTDYDLLDRVTQVVQEGATVAADLVTTNVYNEFGDLERTILPRGNVIEYDYDPAGRLISIERKPDAATPKERTFFTLDAVGNRINEELQRWDGAQWVTESETAFTFTSRCHLDEVTRAPGTPEESTTSFTYDCNGNLEQTWDENHDVATDPPTQVLAYDELDRLVTLTQPWGGTGGGDVVTSYAYDVQDHLVSVTDGEGNLTTYQYSDRDLLTLEDSPVSGMTQHTYNEHGELLSTMDERTVVVSRTVDELDRVTFVDYPGTDLDTTYVYDDPAVDFSLGRLTAIQRHGQSVDYLYDRFGRTTQDGELGYGYDDNGNRVEIGYPGGVTATLTHDFADRPATLDVDPGTGTFQPVVTGSSYLPSGPLSGLTLGNGTTESRMFDGRYAPTEILLDAPNPHRWSYVTDGVGNVTEITETTGCIEADLVLENQTVTTAEAFESCAAIEAGPAFAVESPGDVTMTAGTRVVLKDGFSVGSGASFAAGTDPSQAGTTETRSFDYQDFQYFLTGAGLPWTELSWSYDQIGNRLTETRDGVTDAYAYVANAGGGNTALLDQVSLGVGGTRDYTFGPAGHLEEVAAGANLVDFASDEEGRLAQVSRTGGSSSPFEYDGRSFLTQAGDLATVGVTRPVYSSDGLVMALRRQASAADPELVGVFVYFAGRPVAQIEIGGPETRWWYFTTDHLGTPQVATDEAGDELWDARLEPFGRDSLQGTPDGALENDVFLRLPGQWETDTWQDAALGAGVYYNVHRWYEPGAARYSRSDPANYIESTRIRGVMFPPDNLFAYASQQPLGFVDRLGLLATDAECCSEANEQGLFQARTGSISGGIVICCDGRKVACPGLIGNPMFDTVSDTILTDCIREHERSHFDDVRCRRPCGVYRPTFKLFRRQGKAECRASKKEVECLKREKSRCGGDPRCIRRVDERIAQIRDFGRSFGKCPGL